mgnify:FL=1
MLILLHMTLMIAAALCLIAGVGLAMIGRKKKNWIKLHRAFNTTGTACALIGAIMAFASVAASGGDHLAGLHQRFGLTAVLLTGLTLLMGYYSFQARHKIMVRNVHRWSGRIALIVLLAALYLGLSMIGII